MNIDASIFKSYDIRGIYPTSLNEDLSYKLGQAYATLLQKENPDKVLKIVVSHDMRLSSPQLTKQLINGLTNQGVDVIDIGLASTPTMYFAVAFYGYNGGIQVSASHNPKDYNGYKLVRRNAIPISGDTGIQTLKDLIIEDNFKTSDYIGKVEAKTGILEDLSKSFQKEWPVDFSNIKPLKIVVDAANSMGSLDVEAMFKGLPYELIKLNFDLDGSFPSHQPDPLDEKNLELLQKAVVENNADLGISPDGDGDRYFFIDEKGQIIRQEILRGIMAQIALQQYPGATICYDIRPGKITKDLIIQAGGKPSVTKVGHSLIKEQMIKENAVFGGESSGHYFYKLTYRIFEAPFILVWKFLEFISRKNKPVSEIISPYKIYFHSGEINSTVADTKTKINELINIYSDGKINQLDGVTIEYSHWWFNVRPSNTEPLLRLNLEADSQELMEQKRDEVLNIITK